MSPNNKSILNSIKIIILGLFLAVGVNYLFAWTGPTSTPPNGNVAAPINASYSSQSKLGQLFVNTSTSSPYTNGLVAFGEAILTSNTSGQPALQINDGTAQPGYVLTSTDASGTAKWESASVPTSVPQTFAVCGGPSTGTNAQNCSSIFVGNAGYGIMAETTSVPGTFNAAQAQTDAAGACSVKGDNYYGYTYVTTPPPGCGQNYTKAYYSSSTNSFQTENVTQCGNPHVFISGVYCSTAYPSNLQQ